MSQQFAKDVTMDGVRGRGENLFLGILAGTVAAVIGAFVWMAVELGLDMKLGLVAIAIGLFVGMAVRVAGNGTGMIFGVVGALLTLLGCLGGEILNIVARSSSAEHDYLYTLQHLDLTVIVPAIFAQMSPMSYIIYGIGIFEGYKFSIRK